MKAISEYFRDLAERDRFFGAEPPQPDAEYLHRIAEQTIKSRVAAEVSDNSLILRQEQGSDAEAPEMVPSTAAHVAPAVAAAPAPEAAPTPIAQPATAAFVEPVVADRTGFGEGDTIAEKLQRIRAVVSRENAEPAEDTAFYSEDEHADDFTAPDPVEPPASFVAEDSYDEEAEPADTNIVADIMADIGEDASDEDVTAGADPIAELAEDTVEAEVEVEAAVEDASDVAEDTASTDETEADIVADAEADVEAEAVTEVEAEAEVEVAVEAVAEDAAPVVEDAVEDATADIAAEPEVETETADEDLSETAVADAIESTVNEDAAPAETLDTDGGELADLTSPVAKPRRRIIVQKISRAEVEAAQADDTPPAADDMSAELDAEAEAALMAELADVEADMELGDTQAATADAAQEMAQDTADADIEARALAAAQAAQAQADADAQAAEDAAALAKVMAEAAEVETEAEAEVAQDDSVAEAEDDAAQDNRAARIARRALMDEDEDEALNRLMDATSTRLSDDDEGAVRRASIAHLKAAVAATKADDSIAKAAADEEERELDQYRDDLARVVRPGRARPKAEGSATSRPSPLVLVSEQRIDAPEPVQADAAIDVRPRRIASGNLALAEALDDEVDANLFEEAGVETFSAFAERHDALELPDLLEAAAAHYAVVEGADEFTRPMLMRKIASLTTGAAPSREAGLRSFGALLREGRVVKSGNGKFVLSDKSRFTPEARETGA